MPKNKPEQTFQTELLPTEKTFKQKYGKVIAILSISTLVFIGLFGLYIYITGPKEFKKQLKSVLKIFNQEQNPEQSKPTVQTQPTEPKEIEIQTGYTLKIMKNWESATIINNKSRTEIIASALTNALRVEITSVKKTFPNWEQFVNLEYFDVQQEQNLNIADNEVIIKTGKDGSLFAKTGVWEDSEKILEIKVFSTTEKSTEDFFNQIAESVVITQKPATNAEDLLNLEDGIDNQDSDTANDLTDLNNESTQSTSAKTNQN